MLGDGTCINLKMLNVSHVDWVLKQMVQASTILGFQPDIRIYRYGEALYKTLKVDVELVWKGDFSVAQRHWINQAAVAFESEVAH